MRGRKCKMVNGPIFESSKYLALVFFMYFLSIQPNLTFIFIYSFEFSDYVTSRSEGILSLILFTENKVPLKVFN